MPDEVISTEEETEVPYNRITVINELVADNVKSLADLEVMTDDDLIELYNDTFAPDDEEDDEDDPDKPVECCYCGEMKVCGTEDLDGDPICEECVNDPGDDEDVEEESETIDEESEEDDDDIDDEEGEN